jgi:predicted HAD superfamily Cof-like phosphohydrolase
MSESNYQKIDLVKSNYQKILDFNKAFGVKTNTKPQLDIFDKDPALIQYRLDLILEEVQELKDAINQKDFQETLDALADIQYVVLGAYTAIGINGDQAFDIVHNSNMSKLCKTEQEAIQSVEIYKNEIPQRYNSPAYRKSDDNFHWVVFNKSTMKILKSCKYTPANFDSLINK